MKKQKIIYISGKYSNGTNENNTRKKNILLAAEFAVKLWNLGAAVICPHLNTAYFDSNKKIKISYNDFIKGDITLLKNVDAIFMLPNWKESKGAKLEFEFAKENNIVILYYLIEAKNLIAQEKCCDFCGLVRTKYTKNNNKSLCDNCYNNITDYLANMKNFILTPNLH